MAANNACFNNFDLSEFWEQSDYANKEYVDVPPTSEVLSEVESRLGYRLPTSYVEMSRIQNGGIPKNTCHATNRRTSWADDHVAITGIYSISWEKSCSLCGRFGSQFFMDEWGYPDIGVYFADCPSAGHDMLCLDYRGCGTNGEPAVVHVDQECDYEITEVAENFEAFIRGLKGEDAFPLD